MPVTIKQSRFHVLDGFLIFVPISAAFYYLNVHPVLTFIATAAAIVAISHVIIEMTGIIAQHVSSTVSALLNATFGNVIEFFIAIFSLRAGLIDMVKASMVGSIIINVLLLIGLSMFFGGLKYKEQRFNKDSAGVSSTMLIIVVVGLVLPSVYDMLQDKPAPAMSLAVSVVLGVVYLLGLLYTLFTHKHLFTVEREAPTSPEYRPWSLRTAIILLLIAIGVGSYVSFLMVDTITPIITDIGLTQRFIGLVIIAILTNIPEHISAISFARKDNMTMSLEIGMSSALQIALFVVPALVLLSTAITGNTLDLVFGPFSLISLVMTAMIANYISTDGVCHWMEGVQLIAVYILIVIVFFFV
ncbi:MAG: calcium/proton exchanger [Chloroflexi bacterium RBG_16_50_11]|nr:MAG: calcium/proton exchanger [Chloroflexi bacterium RBG_16_50_11]